MSARPHHNAMSSQTVTCFAPHSNFIDNKDLPSQSRCPSKRAQWVERNSDDEECIMIDLATLFSSIRRDR